MVLPSAAPAHRPRLGSCWFAASKASSA